MRVDLQLEERLLNHLQSNVSPGSSATWLSDVVQAAAKMLACTKGASFRLLTVKELVNNFHHAIQSSLIDENGCTGKEAGSIPVEPVVLLGRLVTDSGSGDRYNGEMFFSDGTGCIVCEVTSGVSLDCMGDVVLLTKWSYILSVPVPMEIIPAYQKQMGTDRNQLVYLEISGYQLLPSAVTAPCAIPDEVYTVQLLEQQVEGHKEQSAVQRGFSVYGQLVANSMLYRTTIEERVFMVQLVDHHFSNSCHIVVQDRHLLHTTNLLSIGETYVFTQLRVKVMTYTKKDVKVQRRVLTTSESSKILEYNAAMTTTSPASDDNVSRKRSLSSGDDDQSQKKHCPDTDSGVVVESLSQHQLQQQCSIGVKSTTTVSTTSVQSAVSYTGTITRCISPEAGIYELDGQVQLFLVHKPCMNLCRGLRVGTTICLDNIHPVKIIDKKDESVLAFCCCSRSSVKVVTFSPINTPYEPLVIRKSLIAYYGHSLNLKKFHWLYKIRSSLKDKLTLVDSCARNGHIRKVFATLYKFSGLVSDKRDIYEEFLSTPHYCPSATVVEQMPYSGAWQLPNIKELTEELRKMLDNSVVQFRSGGVLPLHREKLRTSQDNQTSWTYGVVDPSHFHPPIILAGLVQGSSTGQLVLKDTSGDIQLVICSSYYDEHCITEQRPSIPNIAKLFGQSVVLKKWFIVIENTTGTLQSWDKTTIYVLCSEVDISATDVSQKPLLESGSRKPYFISKLYKQPLMLKCEEATVDLKYTIECVSTGSTKDTTSPRNKQYFNLSRRHLCFYPLLHFGCKYHAVGGKDEIINTIFVEGIPDVNGDVLEVTDIVSNYKLTLESESINIKVVNFTGILVKRKFCYKQDLPVPERYSNLPEIKEGKLVYIRELGCGPVRVDHLKSLDINPAYSKVKLVMEVEGRCVPDNILVYYDLTLTPEPVGLMPGAVLLFTHFQITYNYGRLTCSSSALSKVEVLAVNSTKIQNITPKLSAIINKDSSLYVPSDKLPLKVLIMPTTLLGMLSSKLLDRLLTHGCVKLRCVIVTVLWMRIQHKCATCDKLIVGEKCAPFCSLQQPKFSAECKLIITDGSGEALLYCYDNLVPIVFGCSVTEWKNLEDKTQQFGELTYQKLKKSAGLLLQPHHGLSDSEAAASVFLAQLASRQSVSRNVTICATPFLTNAEAFTPGSKMRQIYVNKICHNTFVLPRIQLRAMVVGPVDCLMECNRLFQQLEQESTLVT